MDPKAGAAPKACDVARSAALRKNTARNQRHVGARQDGDHRCDGGERDDLRIERAEHHSRCDPDRFGLFTVSKWDSALLSEELLQHLRDLLGRVLGVALRNCTLLTI